MLQGPGGYNALAPPHLPGPSGLLSAPHDQSHLNFIPSMGAKYFFLGFLSFFVLFFLFCFVFF